MTQQSTKPNNGGLGSPWLSLATMLLTVAACALACSDTTCAPVQDSATPRIRFAAFNIQVFGRKKARNIRVMDTLAAILARYDIVVVMEIRDKSGRAFRQLVRHTNSFLGEDPFSFVISRRTGRTVSKEQYAVLYRKTSAKVLQAWTLDDTPGDRFQREPYIVRLALKDSEGRRAPLTVMCLHTEPEASVQELNALHDVVKPMAGQPLLIAGDLNADCSYVTQREMASLRLRHDADFNWLIEDAADTTVKSTNCAYDRLITTRSADRLVFGPACVFRFDLEYGLNPQQAAKVSDHYPVELNFDLSV